jgi:hypothetical protein
VKRLIIGGLAAFAMVAVPAAVGTAPANASPTTKCSTTYGLYGPTTNTTCNLLRRQRQLHHRLGRCKRQLASGSIVAFVYVALRAWPIWRHFSRGMRKGGRKISGRTSSASPNRLLPLVR